LLNLLSGVSSSKTAITVLAGADAPVTGLLQWQKDGAPVATALGNQREPQIVSDGAGGGIVVWLDYRLSWGPNAPAHLYAQRVSAMGQLLWQRDGIPVIEVGDQWDPQVVSDGQGGALVAWRDNRTGLSHIYAQRIDEHGALLWAADGLQLSAPIGNQSSPVLAGDGAGGAFVAWVDYGEYQDWSPIGRVQHVQADGSYAWGPEGILVSLNASEEFDPQIVTDSAGGAIVAWRGDCTPGWQGLCIQRLASDGARAWGDYGVIISVAPSSSAEIQLLADNAGGATIVWVDERHLNGDIYAQRISGDGTVRWTSGGVPVSVAPGDQVLPRVVSDDEGGVVVAWHDEQRELPNVLLQRVDAEGQTMWESPGVPVAWQYMQAFYDGERHFDIAPDGAGGTLVGWNGCQPTEPHPSCGILLQRLSAEGILQWPGPGVMVQPSLSEPSGTPRLLTRAPLDTIVVWEDNRRAFKNDEYDIYAQRVVEGSYHAFLPFVAE
jgi:hypothetical protein